MHDLFNISLFLKQSNVNTYLYNPFGTQVTWPVFVIWTISIAELPITLDSKVYEILIR